MIKWFKARYMTKHYPFQNQPIWLRPIQDIYLKIYIWKHRCKITDSTPWSVLYCEKTQAHKSRFCSKCGKLFKVFKCT